MMKSLLILLYSISLLIATAYNYHKGLSEYLCLYKRPGKQISRNSFNNVFYGSLDFFGKEINYGFDGNGFNFGKDKDKNWDGIPANFTEYFSTKDQVKGFVVEGFRSTGDMYNPGIDESSRFYLNYTYRDSHFFTFTCGSRYNYPSTTVLRMAEDGFIEFSNSVVSNPGEWSFSCTQQVYEITCAAPSNLLGEYTVISGAILLFVIGVFMMTFLSNHVKIMMKTFMSLVSLDGGRSFILCNPLNSSFGIFKKGEEFFVISSIFSTLGPDYMSSVETETLKLYVTEDNVLVIIDKLKHEILKASISQEQSMNMRSYIPLLTKDNRNWTTDGKGHYLEPEELISSFRNGGFVSVRSVDKGYKLFCGLNSKVIVKCFKIKEDVAEILVDHNERFFGQFNPAAIENCLQGKTGWFDRPDNVKNCQWKRYCNDFGYIRASMGVVFKGGQYRGRHVKPTRALEESIKRATVEDQPKDKEEPLITVEVRKILHEITKGEVGTIESSQKEIDGICAEIKRKADISTQIASMEKSATYNNEFIGFIEEVKKRDEEILEMERIKLEESIRPPKRKHKGKLEGKGAEKEKEEKEKGREDKGKGKEGSGGQGKEGEEESITRYLSITSIPVETRAREVFIRRGKMPYKEDIVSSVMDNGLNENWGGVMDLSIQVGLLGVKIRMIRMIEEVGSIQISDTEGVFVKRRLGYKNKFKPSFIKLNKKQVEVRKRMGIFERLKDGISPSDLEKKKKKAPKKGKKGGESIEVMEGIERIPLNGERIKRKYRRKGLKKSKRDLSFLRKCKIITFCVRYPGKLLEMPPGQRFVRMKDTDEGFIMGKEEIKNKKAGYMSFFPQVNRGWKANEIEYLCKEEITIPSLIKSSFESFKYLDEIGRVIKKVRDVQAKMGRN